MIIKKITIKYQFCDYILFYIIKITNIYIFFVCFNLGPIALIFQISIILFVIDGLSPNTVSAAKFVNYNGTTYPNIY